MKKAIGFVEKTLENLEWDVRIVEYENKYVVQKSKRSNLKNKTALIEKLFSTHCEIMYNMLQYKQVKNSHKIAMNGKCHFHRFSFRHASPTSFENGCCWNKQR
jgi:hypothetical protein